MKVTISVSAAPKTTAAFEKLMVEAAFRYNGFRSLPTTKLLKLEEYVNNMSEAELKKLTKRLLDASPKYAKGPGSRGRVGQFKHTLQERKQRIERIIQKLKSGEEREKSAQVDKSIAARTAVLEGMKADGLIKDMKKVSKQQVNANFVEVGRGGFVVTPTPKLNKMIKAMMEDEKAVVDLGNGTLFNADFGMFVDTASEIGDERVDIIASLISRHSMAKKGSKAVHAVFALRKVHVKSEVKAELDAGKPVYLSRDEFGKRYIERADESDKEAVFIPGVGLIKSVHRVMSGPGYEH